MSLSPLQIDSNSVTSCMQNIYHKAILKVGDCIGRYVRVIQSSKTNTLPHLQDQRVAAISLVAVNIILFHLSYTFLTFLNSKVTRGRELYQLDGTVRLVTILLISNIIFSITAIFFGVNLFTKFIKLPFSKLTILGISVATCSFSLFLRENDGIQD